MALRVGKEEKRGGYSQGLIGANNVLHGSNNLVNTMAQ